MKRLSLIIIFLSLSLTPLMGADGLGLDPTSLDLSARSLALGRSNLALSDDALTIFHNPAGLSKIKYPKLFAASKRLMLDETTYFSLSGALPTKWGVFGIGFTGLMIDNSLPTKRDSSSNRITLDPSREAIGYENNLILLTYAKEINEAFSLSGSLKFFNQSMGGGGLGNRGTATTLDLGSIYKPHDFLTLGLTLSNIFSQNITWDNGKKMSLKPEQKIGTLINLLGSDEALYFHENQKVDFLCDYEITNSKNHFGLEWSPLESLALRIGLDNSQGESATTFGVGFTRASFRFDYAYRASSLIPGDNPHYFSISYLGEEPAPIIEKEPTAEVVTILATTEPVVILSPTLKLITKDLDRKLTINATIKISGEVANISSDETVTINKKVIKLTEVTTDEYTFTKILPLEFGKNKFILSLTGTDETITDEAFQILRVVPFRDVPLDHWVFEEVAWTSFFGMIRGYQDMTFRPKKGISRAELVTLLMRAKYPETTPVSPETLSVFNDLKVNHWAYPYIAAAVRDKIISGYPDKTFKPNKVLSRAEGITILTRFAKLDLLEEKLADPVFSDVPLNHWVNKYLAPAAAAGYLDYLKAEKFEPAKEFSRAEAVKILTKTPFVDEKIEEFWKN